MPKHEAIAKAAEGKFLFGTDDLTLMDLHIAPYWELLYLCHSGGPMADLGQALNLAKNAPFLLYYIERFRKHWAIKPYQMKK